MRHFGPLFPHRLGLFYIVNRLQETQHNKILNTVIPVRLYWNTASWVLAKKYASWEAPLLFFWGGETKSTAHIPHRKTPLFTFGTPISRRNTPLFAFGTPIPHRKTALFTSGTPIPHRKTPLFPSGTGTQGTCCSKVTSSTKGRLEIFTEKQEISAVDIILKLV